MTSWQDLLIHVKSNYPVAEEDEGKLVVVFGIPGGDRSQVVYIFEETAHNGDEWAHITSPIGRVRDLDLKKVLLKAGQTMCGGATMTAMSDKVLLRHSVHLPSLELDQFRRPLTLIALSADLIERELLGTDEF
jgi:hypothetical protein